jgi:hypothetical protein
MISDATSTVTILYFTVPDNFYQYSDAGVYCFGVLGVLHRPDYVIETARGFDSRTSVFNPHHKIGGQHFMQRWTCCMWISMHFTVHFAQGSRYPLLIQPKKTFLPQVSARTNNAAGMFSALKMMRG